MKKKIFFYVLIILVAILAPTAVFWIKAQSAATITINNKPSSIASAQTFEAGTNFEITSSSTIRALAINQNNYPTSLSVSYNTANSRVFYFSVNPASFAAGNYQIKVTAYAGGTQIYDSFSTHIGSTTATNTSAAGTSGTTAATTPTLYIYPKATNIVSSTVLRIYTNFDVASAADIHTELYQAGTKVSADGVVAVASYPSGSLRNFILSFPGQIANGTYQLKVATDLNGATIADSLSASFELVKTQAAKRYCGAADYSCDWGECVSGIQTQACKLISTYCQEDPTRTPGGKTQACRMSCQEADYACTWSQCYNGQQTKRCTAPSSCTPNFTGAFGPETRTCQPNCTSADYQCKWSDCIDGKKKYECVLTSASCHEVTAGPPAVSQDCKLSCTTADYECGWSECKDSTQFTRCVLKNTDCIPLNLVPEKRECQMPIECSKEYYTCSDWDLCHPDGRQSRTCEKSKPCDRPVSGVPQIFQKCDYVQPEAAPELVVQAPAVAAPVVSQPVAAPEAAPVNIQAPAATANLNQADAPICIEAGFTVPADCDWYLKSRLGAEQCYANNIQTKNDCKKFLIDKYGLPIKCSALNQVECDRLLTNVILANFIETAQKTQAQDQLKPLMNQEVVLDASKGTVTLVNNNKEAASSTPVLLLDKTLIPFAPSEQQVTATLVPTREAAGTIAAAFVLDSDYDGLPDDVEKRIGTDPFKADTDGDGYPDSVEVATGFNPLGPGRLGKISGLDLAIAHQIKLEQPKGSAASTSLQISIDKIETVGLDTANKKSQLLLTGKAVAGTVVTIFIYSDIPLVVTALADTDGNWTYQLDKTLIDGKHEVYVAINDKAGSIAEQSVPKSFFIKEAKAVSVDDYVQAQEFAPIADSSNLNVYYFIAGGILLIVIALISFIILRRRIAGSYGE
ncbi:MAG: Ig-like domain-containing protein [Candidatus Falkowbacteria bacterium]